MLLVIVWRLSSNGELLGKDLFGDLTIDLAESIYAIVEFFFELVGFFVVMIVLGEILRRAYRGFIRQIAAQEKEEHEKVADQDTLRISIILTLCFLVFTIS